MKRIVAGAAALALLSPAAAHAHDSRGWYWTAQYAADRLVQSYGDVARADCLGFGPWSRGNGRNRYSHFSCGVEFASGGGIEVTVEVLGRRRARVLYGNATDIIR